MSKQAIVGRDGGSATFPVDRSKIRELALAIGDDDPIYSDPEAAARAGFAGVPGPLTWPVLAGHWRDGAAVNRRLGLDYRRLLHGETTWEYMRPVTAGEVVDARRTVVDVREKEGRRGGRMTFITFETIYRDAAGDLIARQTDTLIQTGG